MVGHLEALLSIRPAETRLQEEFIAQGTLINHGSEALILNLMPLIAPSLALEIADAAGAPVLLPPPPVPGGEIRTVEVTPGRSYTVEYPGFVPQWTPPGVYRARLRYIYQPSTPTPGEWTGKVTSDWAAFKILP